MTQNVSTPRSAAAGITMILCAAVSVVAVAHHPAIEHATTAADVLAQMVRLSGVDEAVHGILIVAACGLLFGLAAFAARRGLHDDAVLAGLVAYGVGTVAVIAAALIDGFLLPAIAARYATAPPPRPATAVQIITVCAAAVQIATKTWLLATSFAVLAWSFGLLRYRGPLRVTGAGGIVSTVLVLAVLAFSATLNPHNLGAVVVLQTLWYVAVGALMTRGEL